MLRKATYRPSAEIDGRGGAAASIGYVVDEIQRAAYAYQMGIEHGERIVVGVNEYRDEEAEAARIDQPAFPELEAQQRERLDAVRRRRNAGEVRAALDRLTGAASGRDGLLPLMVEAVKARATLGEISDALRNAWGEYRATS